MVYPTDEETFNARVSPEFITDNHLNDIQAFLKRIQDFIGYGGRIHDEAGLVSPVGIIAPYCGDSSPSGWLLCNGKEYDGGSANYIDLFAVIGTKYGNRTGDFFNVPDFRANFLRGNSIVAGQTFGFAIVDVGNDRFNILTHEFYRTGFPFRITSTGVLPAPLVINTTYYAILNADQTFQMATSRVNALARTAINITTQGTNSHTVVAWLEDDKDARIASTEGGDSGEDLGSYQADEVQLHSHAYQTLTAGAIIQSGSGYGVIAPQTGGFGGTETRAKNVGVNFIIKL